MRESNTSSFTGQKSRVQTDNSHLLHLEVPLVFQLETVLLWLRLSEPHSFENVK